MTMTHQIALLYIFFIVIISFIYISTCIFLYRIFPIVLSFVIWNKVYQIQIIGFYFVFFLMVWLQVVQEEFVFVPTLIFLYRSLSCFGNVTAVISFSRQRLDSFQVLVSTDALLILHFTFGVFWFVLLSCHIYFDRAVRLIQILLLHDTLWGKFLFFQGPSVIPLRILCYFVDSFLLAGIHNFVLHVGSGSWCDRNFSVCIFYDFQYVTYSKKSP